MKRKRITLCVRKKAKKRNNTSADCANVLPEKKRSTMHIKIGRQGAEGRTKGITNDCRIVAQDEVLDQVLVEDKTEKIDEEKREKVKGKVQLRVRKGKMAENRDEKENVINQTIVNEQVSEDRGCDGITKNETIHESIDREKKALSARSVFKATRKKTGNTDIKLTAKGGVKQKIRIGPKTICAEDGTIGSDTTGVRGVNLKGDDTKEKEKLNSAVIANKSRLKAVDHPVVVGRSDKSAGNKMVVSRRGIERACKLEERTVKILQKGSNPDEINKKMIDGTPSENQRDRYQSMEEAVNTERLDNQNSSGEQSVLSPQSIIDNIMEKGSDFDVVMQTVIREQFSDQVQAITRIMSEEDHALLIFIDPYIECVVKSLLKTQCAERHDNVHFLDVDGAKDETLYGELEDHSSFAFLTTRNAMVVEKMERRIRSRFNNVKMFFGYLKGCKVPVELIRSTYLSHKYGVQQCDFYNFLKVFKPLHVAVILCWMKRGLSRSKLVLTMKDFLFKVSEMKNVSDKEIIDAFYEVESTKIVRKNKFNGDYHKLVEYIKKDMPFYMKRLI